MLTKQKRYILYSLVFSIIAFSLVALVLISRISSGSIILPGEESYAHLSQADAIRSDTSSSHLMYDILLSWVLKLLPLNIVIWLLPCLLLLATFVLFGVLLTYTPADSNTMLYSFSLLTMSPAILLMYIGFSAHSLTIFLTFLVAYLFLRKSSWYFAVIPILFFADMIIGFLMLLALLFFESLRSRKSQVISITLLAIGLFFASGFFPSLSFYSLSSFFTFKANTIFSFFGGDYGFSLTTLFLGLYGLILSKDSFTITKRQSIILLLLLLSLFYAPLRILSLFVLSYYGAVAFKHLLLRKWSVTNLKNITLLLIICILIFSTSTTLKETASQKPSMYEIEGLELISTIVSQSPSMSNAMILSHPDYSDHISYYANLPTYSSSRSQVIDILSSRQYSFVKKNLQDNDIAFIVIDRSLQRDNLFQRDEQGILFVLQNNRIFKKVYQHADYTIYYYSEWNLDDSS